MKKKLLVVMVALMCVLSLAAAPKKAKKAKKSKNKDLNISVFTMCFFGGYYVFFSFITICCRNIIKILFFY